MHIYKDGGREAVIEAIDNLFLDSQYVESYLKDIDVSLGYYEDIKYIFVANKDNKNLKLFSYKNNNKNLLSDVPAFFGENNLDKRISGDLATPVGVYELTSKLDKLDDYYGPLAFTTSYPNLYDRLNKKTGHGIWIHGVPTKTARQQSTRGCIVIENYVLKIYETLIDHKKTILITTQKDEINVEKRTIALILSSLLRWKKAWADNDINQYLSFYSKDFIRFDGMTYNNFSAFKATIFNKKENKKIEFSKVNIIPYPNSKHEEIYKVNFIENYRSSSGYTFNGLKEIYIKIEDGQVKIIIEK